MYKVPYYMNYSRHVYFGISKLAYFATHNFAISLKFRDFIEEIIKMI